MKNIFPIMKLTERKTLVERRRDDGSLIEYIICDSIKPVKNGEPNEYEWANGMYSFTLEGAIKTAALYCYEPIRRYVVVETETGCDIEEDVFDRYEDAHKYMEEQFKKYRDYEDCTYHEYETGLHEEIGTIWFGEKTIQLKLIEVTVK